MSTTAIAFPAINTYLYLGSTASPTVYTNPIANVGDYTGPGMSKQVVDVTSHSAVVPWREKITTLLDGGDLTLPLYFIPDDTDLQALLTVFLTNGFAGIRWYKLLFTDGTFYTFEASISKWNYKIPVAGVVTVDVTFTITGEVFVP
jgi:hypothetical protein